MKCVRQSADPRLRSGVCKSVSDRLHLYRRPPTRRRDDSDQKQTPCATPVFPMKNATPSCWRAWTPLKHQPQDDQGQDHRSQVVSRAQALRLAALHPTLGTRHRIPRERRRSRSFHIMYQMTYGCKYISLRTLECIATAWRLSYRPWRRGSESNRRTRLCRPLHDHSATPPGDRRDRDGNHATTPSRRDKRKGRA